MDQHAMPPPSGSTDPRARRRATLVVLALGAPLLLAAAFLVGSRHGPRQEPPREVIDEAQPPAPLLPPVPPAHVATRLVMRHVRLRQADTFYIDVRHLLGRMLPSKKGSVPVFGDARSYEVQTQQAEVAVSAASLTGLLNNYVFAYKGAPLRQLRVTMTPDHHLRQQGILHKGFDIPFTIIAEVQPTSDGKLRIHPTDIRISNLAGKLLMKLLHVELADVLDLSGAKGVKAEHNDLLLDPQEALPPPRMLGRLRAVRIEGDELVQELGPAAGTPHVEPPPPPPDREVANYIHLYGGTVRFGRLFMVSTNLQVADAHPQDPFEFYTTYFDNQLAAGYSRSHLDGSLTTYCPDFAAVGKRLERAEIISPSGS